MSLCKTWQLSQRTFASQQGCSHILLLRWPNKTNKQTFCWLWVCEGRGNCHKGICIKTATLTNPSHKVSKQNKQSFCPPPLRIFLPFYGPVMYLLIVSLWKTWQSSRRTFASRFMEPFHFLFNLFCCLPHTIQPRCNTDKPNKTWRRKRECMQPLSQCNVSKKNLKLFLDHE